jgi:hypothetical protein
MTTKNLHLVLCALAIFGLGGLVADPAVAETRTPAFSDDPEAVKSRLENVRKLVTTSSGARRIIEGGNPAAKAKRADAEVHLRSAEEAYSRGDMKGAQADLQRATEEMFEAIREVGTGKAGVDKLKRDFDNKAKSVDVLLNAIERVADEKGGRSDVQQRASAIRQRARAAQSTADQGDLVAARKQLDGVYEDAKHELEKLREGETLVRTLEFASAEEEYHYELDRNDTHQMLLKVLVEERETNPGMQKLIDNYHGKSTQLRTQAEAEAGRGAFDLAVKSLEEATKFLQRAIRSAGVYIPG